MGTRREFIRETLLGGAAICLPGTDLLGATPMHRPLVANPKISLAQWSLHRALQKGEASPAGFPAIAKGQFGIGAVEYVSTFYNKELGKTSFWQSLRRQAESEGVESLLIMVDGEGHLGAPDSRERARAGDRHGRWLETARILGCHSIRVKAFGSGDRKDLKAALTDGLGRLSEAGKDTGVHVLIENHGLHTSDASFMVQIIREVDNPYLGTLPDFGNWCLEKEWGSTKGGTCTRSYDPVRGLEEFLPYARGVSAKSYDFDPEGNETRLPYRDLLQKVKDVGFAGHIGIEYEGDRLTEAEGIRATKALIESTWGKLD